MEETHAGSLEPTTNSWLSGFLLDVLSAFRSVKFSRRERYLRLGETLQLGEKRMLAIVECNNERFLIGATSQSVSLLHRLDGRLPATEAEENEKNMIFTNGVEE